MSNELTRTIFETSRAAEYFNARELQAQTGQTRDNFVTVVLKELVDNALDACETARIAPEIDLEIETQNGLISLAVSDNGNGIEPETIQRILNFQTRTSDKSVYKSPTRGAQGNALKTIIGMPHALGGRHPVIIESKGIRHSIRAWTDPAGELRIEHNKSEVDFKPGTKIALNLPSAGQDFSPDYWAKAYSLFNPHALVRIREIKESNNFSYRANSNLAKNEDSYHPTVIFPDDWRKFLPTDLTAPVWYNLDDLSRLIFSHINQARNGGDDLTLRDFVRQFRGLSGTAKAKKVCDRVKWINRLTDLETDTHGAISCLMSAMKTISKPPSPNILGEIGKDHLEGRLNQLFGVNRFWYKKETGSIRNMPFIFEAAIAETDQPGRVFTGVNFSPTYEDPLASTHLSTDEIYASGLEGFLISSHTAPWDDPYENVEKPNTAAVFHLVCPSLEFLDRGKTRLRIPDEMREAIKKACWKVVKTLYGEYTKREKDAAKQEKADRNRQLKAEKEEQDEKNLKDACFDLIPQAMAKASGDGKYPVSTKDLHYAIRPMIQPFTSKELKYSYFSQTIVTLYRQNYGEIKGLYYDPRGELYEPHTNKVIPLGTQDVEKYVFPSWRYDKIIYIEKKGRASMLKAARLGEKYDMAIIAAEGYASEAARMLFEHADKKQDYQLFVLHDADPYGYNIARTLQEETRRMPGYSVNVIDLGLSFDDGLEMGLLTEEFTRKKALPESITERLTEREKKAFVGRQVGKKSWICERIELNALTAPQFIEYTEKKLLEVGIRNKVIPSAKTLPGLCDEIYRAEVSRRADQIIDSILNTSEIKHILIAALGDKISFDKAEQQIKETFNNNPYVSWDSVVTAKVASFLREQHDFVKSSIRDQINQRLDQAD